MSSNERALGHSMIVLLVNMLGFSVIAFAFMEFEGALNGRWQTDAFTAPLVSLFGFPTTYVLDNLTIVYLNLGASRASCEILAGLTLLVPILGLWESWMISILRRIARESDNTDAPLVPSFAKSQRSGTYGS